jgi:hypothetical protein
VCARNFTCTYRQTNRQRERKKERKKERKNERKKERKRERERKKPHNCWDQRIDRWCVCVEESRRREEKFPVFRTVPGFPNSSRFSEQFPVFQIVPGFPRTNFRLEIREQKIKFLGLVLGNRNGKIMVLSSNIFRSLLEKRVRFLLLSNRK